MKPIFYISLLVLMFTSSCKQFLDIKPYGKTIPKTSEEFAALLHSRLNDVDYGRDETLFGNFSTVSDFETYADNLDASLTNYPKGSTLSVYVGSRINNLQTRYERLYQIIRDCNIIISNLKENVTVADRTVLGTAHAMRGISYYNLLREYCEPYSTGTQMGVPLVVEFDMEERPRRSTYKQTMDFIESDLMKSLEYKVTDTIFRFTEDVTKAYLARFYFWTGNWDQAIVYADDLLKSYPLLSGDAYKDMIQAQYQKKGNVIFRSYMFSDPSSNISYNAIKDIIKARPASKEFAEIFTEGSRDIRQTFYLTSKRENTKNLIAAIRSDEMCLILAEAYAHKNDEDKALFYLNHLRSFRISEYVPYTIATLPAIVSTYLVTQDATGKAITPLTQAILTERRKELYMEGDRWFELKRNGRPVFWVANDGRKYVTHTYLYTFPIPRVDVELIDGLVQNPGYQY